MSSSYSDTLNVPLYEFSDEDGTLVVSEPGPMTEKMLLEAMRTRLSVLGSPVPDGYVAPPGIDLATLLKQVPWPPAA